MAAALVLLLCLLLPGLAAGQTTQPPSRTEQQQQIETDVRTPPPPTIPSTPRIPLPAPPPEAVRPVQLFELRPGVGLSEEYSDNFNRSARNKQENFRTTLSPALTVLLNAGFLTGRAAYTLAGSYDSSLPDELSLFNSLSGRLSLEATPRLKLNASYGLTQSDQPSQADRLGLRQERQKFTSNAVSLDALYSLANVDLKPYYRLSSFSQDEGSDTTSHAIGASASTVVFKTNTVTLGYEYLKSESEQGGSGATGATTLPETRSQITGHQVNGSVARELTPRSTVGVSGAYSMRTQERTNPASESDFSQRTVSLFNSYVIPNTIALRGSIGVSQLIGDTSSGQPLLSTSSSLSYWFGQAVASLSMERGFSETFSEGENRGVVQTTGYSGSLSYPFTPSFSGRASVSYRENEVTGVGATGSSTGSGAQTDNVLTGTISFSYQILRWLGSTLEYNYSKTSSSEADRDNITENRFKLALTASF
jgi:hypothetical protein